MIAALPEITIHPGQIHLAQSPSVLQTILGSCVGVTFLCSRLGAGALCHGVLPSGPRGVNVADGLRYVDFSIRYLTHRFEMLGAFRGELEVKLFGGADVLPVAANRASKPTIGALNCRAALEVLQAEGLRVLASDLGGTRGRSIYFYTDTGDVLVRRLGTAVGGEAKL